MAEIRFDLGKNITETARASGPPQFQTDNINGLVSFSIDGIKPTVPARYVRPGYEVEWQPIFAFTMYADHAHGDDLKVDSVTLQLDNTFARSHEQTKAFVEQTIAQFQRGKWQRYHNAQADPLLTGRSSLLDESGQVDSIVMAPDPEYNLPPNDWMDAAKSGIFWRWHGDGVLATLSLNNYGGDGPGHARPDAPDLKMNLEFELLDIKLQRDAENLARKLKEGDTKGWNSTAEHEADKQKAAARIKVLEANAIARGDAVVEPSR